MSKTHRVIVLSAEVRKELTEWVNAHGTPQPVVKRCQIVLRDADGASDVQTAGVLGLSRHTCRLWRQRFVSDGAQALWKVAPGRGRKPDGPRQQRIVEATVKRKPKGQTHWSARTLARDQGVGQPRCCACGGPINSSRIWRRPSTTAHTRRTKSSAGWPNIPAWGDTLFRRVRFGSTRSNSASGT